MKLEKLRIRNFRSYKDSQVVSVGNKLVLVGENNAGKSNVLRALDMFFDISPTSPHTVEDFHMKDTEEDIEIEAWFEDLSEEEKEVFDEFLVDDRLWVKTVYPFDDEGGVAENKQFVVKKEVPAEEDFRGYDDITADEAEEIYKRHEEKLQPHQVEDWSGNLYKNEIQPTIGKYLESDDAEWENEEVVDPRGIKKKLKAHLPEFEYFESDRNIEDATKTSTSALLGKLLDDALDSVSDEEKSEIEDALEDVDEKLNQEDKFDQIKDLESELQEKLSEHVPVDNVNLEIDVPDLDSILSRVNVSIDDGVKTDITTMGSGLHTSFILACLWQINEGDTGDKDIIFGLEEPENDLHPHAQRQLYDTLDDLAEQDYQVVLSTHSAFLVSSEDLFDTVRVEKPSNESQLHSIDTDSFDEQEMDKIRSKITPDNNEVFFSRAVLLCEGQSELQALPVLNSLVDGVKDDVYAFDRLGISLIEVNGKIGFKNFLKVTDMFNIQSIVLVDNDREKDEGHEELIEELEEKADELVELPLDFEEQFFSSITFEQFCTAMSRISNYDTTADNLSTRQENTGESRQEILRSEFEKEQPSKPQLGRTLAKEVSEDEVPEEIVHVFKQCKEIV
ncbi:ATP-dependent nuclease [Halopiger aswanensis]|uniref:Putative ATP-dependent endonuclease of OLD family n=1 Tax=Halopiger aswanensis TaxID=148449 RepID=A0A3R7GJ47_9EURY|nr:AAA family ATPase [Halopiger aswanensis]RKD95625.1 putative ATP-dependent endonuclease of OLD family [Halopiger aswanensis]